MVTTTNRFTLAGADNKVKMGTGGATRSPGPRLTTGIGNELTLYNIGTDLNSRTIPGKMSIGGLNDFWVIRIAM
jgi:hypothetical protein